MADKRDDTFFSALVEALPVAVYATDAEGRIIFYNDAAASLWGRRPTLGEDWWCGSWRLYWPDGTPMRHDECPMAVTIKTGKPVRGAEAVAERPDGTRVTFVPYPTPLFDRGGTLSGVLNLLIDVSDSKPAQIAAQLLAAIVESSEDAIASKTLDGVINSWNGAAERLFGYTPQEIVGKSVRVLIPQDRQQEEDEILGRVRNGERIAHFETVRRAKDGRLLDVSLTVSPVRDESGRIVGASKIVRDIGEAKRAQRRVETLFRVSHEISLDFDLERVVQAVTDLATQACGAKFGAFFYNVDGEAGESYLLYTLSGAPRERFETFGMPRNTEIFGPTFRGEGVVRSGDIRKDPRYGKNRPHHGMPEGHLPVVSYLAAPVISAGGDVHGGLFFGHDQPDMFDEEAEDLVTAIAVQAAAAMDKVHLHRAMQTEIEQRREAEAGRQLLTNEIKHRIKNTLATVHALATQTFKSASGEERKAFSDRIIALSNAHDTLTQKNWSATGVRETTEQALNPFVDGRSDRIILSGSDTELQPNKALLLSMLLHELGTNAVKYGALSNATGAVSLSWEAAASKDGKPALQFVWDETGGPKVTPPTRKGFGSRLIERALSAEKGSAELIFAPEGVRCTLLVPVGV